MANFLLQAANAIKHQFVPKEVNSTNTTFTLFSKISFGLCIFASILVTTSQNIGKPIDCSLGKHAVVGADLLNNHCWIYGTFHIPEEMQKDFPCRAKKGADENALIYYQWIVFMLVISAFLFKIPHLIWKSYEGGIMKAFFSGKGQKSRLLSDDDANQNLEFNLKYYDKLKGHNNTYYYMFQICQMLNIVMLALNWWVTDKFLGGNFNSYGTDFIDYQSLSTYEKQDENAFNPMCNAFPTTVSCSIKYGSASGAVAEANGLCLLSQNIFNEKIYLFLWFWFVLLFIIGTIQMIFEIAVFAMPSFRSFVISRQTGAFNSGEMKKFIERCNHGDWFILHLIGKNTNKYFFFDLVEKLAKSGLSNPLDNRDNEELLHKNHGSNENVTIPMEEFENKENLS